MQYSLTTPSQYEIIVLRAPSSNLREGGRNSIFRLKPKKNYGKIVKQSIIFRKSNSWRGYFIGTKESI